MPFFNAFSSQPGLFFVVSALFVTGTLSLFMAVTAWRYRHINAALTFSIMMAAAGIYSLGYFFELNSNDLSQAFFWIRVQYLGIAFLPTLWLLFILQYTDRQKWLNKTSILFIFLIPFTVYAMVLTNEWHNLYYKSISLVSFQEIQLVSLVQGPWYWVHISYFVIAYLLSAFYLLETYLNSSFFFKKRFLLLLIGSLFPGAAFLIYILGLVPIPLDLVPFGLFFAGIIFLGDLVYFKPFEVLPVARASVFNSIQAGLLVLDFQNRIIDINETAQKLFGPARSLLGKPAEMVLDFFSEPHGYKEREVLEWFFDSPGGRQWFDIRFSEIKSHSQGDMGSLLIIQNITQRKEAEAALLESEALKSSIVEAMPDLLARFNREGHCLDILGEDKDIALPRDKMQGKNVKEIWPPPLSEKFMAAIHTALDSRNLQALEYKLKKDSDVFFFEARIKAYAKDEAVAMIRDITQSKLYQQKLEYLSLHDQLTGLYNRTFFEEEIQRFSRSRDYPITIISADVDGLKSVNDTLGHDQGDNLLKAAASVMKKSLRRGDIFARVGGDEFAVILPRTGFPAGKDVVERIRERIDRYNKKGAQLPLNISIGLATAEDNTTTLAECFKEADNAMYRDKQNRKNNKTGEIQEG